MVMDALSTHRPKRGVKLLPLSVGTCHLSVLTDVLLESLLESGHGAGDSWGWLGTQGESWVCLCLCQAQHVLVELRIEGSKNHRKS